MSIRHFPLSRSVIVDVLYAIVSRPIYNTTVRPTTKCLLHQQPLTSTWRYTHDRNLINKFNSKCGLQRSHYSTQASPLAFEDTTDTRRNIESLVDDLDHKNQSNTNGKKHQQQQQQQQLLDKKKSKNRYKQFTKIGPDGNPIVVTAYKLKTKKKKPTTVSEYNRLIIYAVMENRVNKAISYLREMERRSIKPDVYTYTMIINGYSKQSDMIRARKWLDRMLKNGIEPDAHIYTSLIDGYMREADVDRAETMFRIMMKKDIKPALVTYNILMHHSVRQLNMESALKFWGNLLEAGLKSDVYTYVIILHGLGDEGRVDEAWRIFKTMQDEKVDVNEVVATTLMGMHVKQHDNEYAIQLFNRFFNTKEGSKTALPITDHTRNVLLNAVVAKADSETITRYYNQYKDCLENKDTTNQSPLFVGANVYTYTTFMRAFLRRDNLPMVSQVFADMTTRHIQPSLVTYATLMLAHAYVPDPESCTRILEELKKGGIQLNAVLYTIVMRAWAKAGRWEKVKSTYELMKKDNIQPTKLTMEVLRYGTSRSNNADI